MMKHLNLYAGAVAMAALLLSACGGATEAKTDFDALVANGWKLKEIVSADSTYTIMPERAVTVTFSDSSTVAGFAGCNNFFGTFSTIGQNEMVIETKGRTMSMCPDIEFEDRFVSMLDLVTSYSVLNGELSLNDVETGMTMLFEPETAPETK